ncbi:TPA: tryptophan--tRNA ligase [Candidatus Peregrinibacteria bacterium]|nr:tryptophan--tRNA ligase [Candidatus Peregrinibacteria bacterium]
MSKSILTGIQPSGRAHIGNYFGAIKPAIQLASEYEKSIIFIADLHSLTTLQDKKLLQQYTFDLAVSYLAAGLDPEKTILFKQSDVSAHAELSWILSTITPMGMLERATSYKDKKNKGLEVNAGLFTYPILMASDILLYSPDVVPVGKDQKQHLEIARDLASKFNHIYGGSALKQPEPVISEKTGIIPGLDGQKMSKSYGNTIPLFGTKKEIRKTIMSIVTDSKEVADKKDPETCTIFTLTKFFLSEDELTALSAKYKAGGMGYGEAKQILWEGLEKKFTPMWEREAELRKNPEKVYEILKEGAEKANRIATRQLEKIKKRVGLG